MISESKRKLVRILFSCALFLLVVYIALEKFYPKAYGSPAFFSGVNIDSAFISALDEYGIEKSWIFKKNDLYRIKLPQDLPSEVIVLSFSEKINNPSVKIAAKEIVKGGKSRIDVSADEVNLLTAEFEYDKNISRNTSQAAFILINAEDLDENERLMLLNLQEDYSLAVEPSQSNRKFAFNAAEKGKEYSILINNNADELEYRLDDKFSDKKLIYTVQTIIEHFDRASLVLIDRNSSRLSERAVIILVDEIRKRRMNFYPLDAFVHLGNSDTEVLEKALSSGRRQTFVIEAELYLQILDNIRELRKKGLKVVSASYDGM